MACMRFLSRSIIFCPLSDICFSPHAYGLPRQGCNRSRCGIICLSDSIRQDDPSVQEAWKGENAMKVLVTGASGQLGTFVIRALRERHDVVLMSRQAPAAEFAALPWVRGDLTVFDVCRRAVQGVDAIQHLAAQPWPVDHPALRGRAAAQGIPFDVTFKSNMLGVYYLMQAAVEAGVERVIMAGSNCALGHGYRISQTPFSLQAL